MLEMPEELHSWKIRTSILQTFWDIFGIPEYAYGWKGQKGVALYRWQRLYRCECGDAYLEQYYGPCDSCGIARWKIPWIGRAWGSLDTPQWLSWDKLPTDIQLEIIRILEAPVKLVDSPWLEAEIEKRVKARLEVELAKEAFLKACQDPALRKAVEES